MVTVALFIFGSAGGLLWLDFLLCRVRAELERERASRAEAVEAARAEGFRLGSSLCPMAGGGGPVRDQLPAENPEAGERVPAGAAGGAR